MARFRKRRTFRRKRPMRKVKRMKRFSRLLTRLGRPKSELKHHFYAFDDLPVTSTRFDYPLFDDIQLGLSGSVPGVAAAIGTDSTNRIGDKIWVEYIYLNLWLYKHLRVDEEAALDPNLSISRIRLLQWKGEASSNATLLGNILGAVDGAQPVFARTNTYQSDCRVKLDKAFVLSPPEWFVPVTAAGAQAPFLASNGSHRSVARLRKKIRIHKLVKYDPTNVGTPSYCRLNDLSLHLNSNLVSGNAPYLNGYISIAFRDA